MNSQIRFSRETRLDRTEIKILWYKLTKNRWSQKMQRLLIVRLKSLNISARNLDCFRTISFSNYKWQIAAITLSLMRTNLRHRWEPKCLSKLIQPTSKVTKLKDNLSKRCTWQGWVSKIKGGLTCRDQQTAFNDKAKI